MSGVCIFLLLLWFPLPLKTCTISFPLEKKKHMRASHWTIHIYKQIHYIYHNCVRTLAFDTFTITSPRYGLDIFRKSLIHHLPCYVQLRLNWNSICKRGSRHITRHTFQNKWYLEKWKPSEMQRRWISINGGSSLEFARRDETVMSGDELGLDFSLTH